MITGEELTHLADVTRNAYPRNDVAVKLACAVKEYVAQEPAREAAVAWAEAELSYSKALVAAYGLGGTKRGGDAEKALCMKVGKVADVARESYLALRAAQPTETEPGRTRCSLSFPHQPHDFCDGNLDAAPFGAGLMKPSPAPPQPEARK